jgi:hypothetical protein
MRAFFAIDTDIIETVVSMYRPRTKKGDPRIWFRGLPAYAKPGDLMAVIVARGELYVMNVSQLVLGPGSAALELLGDVSDVEARDAQELLRLVRAIAARGPIRATGTGSTAVGRTLETLLGIAINSAKRPDWRSIEIKSFRGSRANRKTLFAQVPEWSLSGCKSSAEILRLLGYQRPGAIRKLYVTVSATRDNAQGLRLRLSQSEDTLIESSSRYGSSNVATWRLTTLRRRLAEKHAETFWVEADSSFVDGKEYFHYRRITHTRAPIVAQLEPLLDVGSITIDHLIKDDGARVVEKGPQLKIDDSGHRLLFPRPRN